MCLCTVMRYSHDAKIAFCIESSLTTSSNATLRLFESANRIALLDKYIVKKDKSSLTFPTNSRK